LKWEKTNDVRYRTMSEKMSEKMSERMTEVEIDIERIDPNELEKNTIFPPILRVYHNYHELNQKNKIYFY
jgi:hypothetical protein